MGAGMLVSLSSVKEYLGITNDTADAMLTRMIRGASTFVLGYLNRTGLELRDYAEMYDTYGAQFMVLRNNPVYAVSAISISGVPKTVAAGNGISTPFTNGYVLSPAYAPLMSPNSQRLDFYGYRLPNARGQVYVQYRAGFVMVDELVVPGTPFQYTTNYFWLANVAVAYSNGDALTEVAASPTEGQYAVSVDGVYLFAAADVGETVLISYSYTPADIQDAIINIVSARYRYMDRIGIVSKSLGGQETISYSQKSMDEFTRDQLQPYRNTIPS